MKKLFLALMTALSLANIHAATLKLDGKLTSNITEPVCTFKLKGNIRNVGSSSGTLKMILMATPNPFPSPGVIVGEYTLGTLPNGYQITDFTVKTNAKLPTATGNYHLTITIAEYTGAGWKNIFAEKAGTQNMVNGDIAGQKKWPIPSTKAVPPIGKLPNGMRILLDSKATGDMNLIPTAFQEKSVSTVKSKNKLETVLNGRKKAGKFTIAAKDGTFNKQRVTYSQIVIDYGSGSKSTLSLYFQGTYNGTYKNVEKTSVGSITTWGTFKLQ
ncbi:hypothetical protein JIN84_06530 [Luteolibacter yonseiensis]|uniref:Uncharacterized protein n=1 Tax=Luteolibacter yonseiensis TaxID=1144680 RepID=A0A934R1K7_9BACT|nr:hypothetical protein [Luteolibacter yonseiensis]MBK1815261.1 hypothetical protein [Luteolibacter yonseiensis]